MDGVTPKQFNAHLESNLDRLHRQLRRSYNFSELQAHFLAKPDGKKERVICIPTVQDRLVQRVLAAHLTVLSDGFGIINDVSYGFVRGKDGKPRFVAA